MEWSVHFFRGPCLMLCYQKEFEQHSSWQSLRSPHVHQCCQERSFSKPNTKNKSIIGLVLTLEGFNMTVLHFKAASILQSQIAYFYTSWHVKSAKLRLLRVHCGSACPSIWHILTDSPQQIKINWMRRGFSQKLNKLLSALVDVRQPRLGFRGSISPITDLFLPDTDFYPQKWPFQ